jgi:CIC family chloride channel protein
LIAALRRLRERAGVRALVEHEATRLLVAGVLVGVLGGLAASVFDRAMTTIGVIVLGTPSPAEVGPAWWRALIGPAACGVLAGVLIVYGTVRKRPQSVPDVMERVQLDMPSLSLRDGLVSALAAAVVVGGGQSGGREGPIVQLASTLAAAVCRQFGVPARHFRSLVAAGAAAGVAASFNTPVGGAFFALEIILGDFGVESFAPVVAATVTATVVGQALLGDRVALQLPAFKLHSPVELVFYLVLGGISGVVAVVFKRAILWGSARADRLGLNAWQRCGAAGLAVGVVAALGMHEVMGNGYGWMERSITDTSTVGIAFLSVLLVVKIAATTVTMGGRGGAGLFAPSLYVGAVTGLLVGKLSVLIAPGHVPSAGAYGMVGMGAVASGVLHAPITMTLMLFEMTGNYQVILPLLVALSAAGLVSRLLGAESVYESELRHRGVSLKRPSAANLLDGLTVADVMRRDALVTVGPDEPLREVVRRFVGAPSTPIFVLDAEGRLAGRMQLHTATARLFEGDAAVAKDVVAAEDAIHGDQPLAAVVPQFFHAQTDAMPVVDGDGKPIGVLYERDVIATYHRFLQRRDTLLARFESGDPEDRTTDFVELPDGYGLEVVEVDARLGGQTLRDLSLPEKQGCLVIAHSVWDASEGRWHRRPADARRRLEKGDRLVVMGPVKQLGALATR